MLALVIEFKSGDGFKAQGSCGWGAAKKISPAANWFTLTAELLVIYIQIFSIFNAQQSLFIRS